MASNPFVLTASARDLFSITVATQRQTCVEQVQREVPIPHGAGGQDFCLGSLILRLPKKKVRRKRSQSHGFVVAMRGLHAMLAGNRY